MMMEAFFVATIIVKVHQHTKENSNNAQVLCAVHMAHRLLPPLRATLGKLQLELLLGSR